MAHNKNKAKCPKHLHTHTYTHAMETAMRHILKEEVNELKALMLRLVQNNAHICVRIYVSEHFVFCLSCDLYRINAVQHRINSNQLEHLCLCDERQL